MIYETVITTLNADGGTHVAPMGIRRLGEVVEAMIEIAPFRPSITLENLIRTRAAIVNVIDDVRLIAGPLTGRSEYALCAVEGTPLRRLHAALAHSLVEVTQVIDDPQRPRFQCRVRSQETHAPFQGFNRAQAAVVEGAILVSRLHLLPAEKIERELAYLQIAIDKTAGAREREAWGWLLERIRDFRVGQGHAA